jgi:hypothetical protein
MKVAHARSRPRRTLGTSRAKLDSNRPLRHSDGMKARMLKTALCRDLALLILPMNGGHMPIRRLLMLRRPVEPRT